MSSRMTPKLMPQTIGFPNAVAYLFGEIPGDPQSGGEFEDCFEYVLRNSYRGVA
jgi:hypothetical protein